MIQDPKIIGKQLRQAIASVINIACPSVNLPERSLMADSLVAFILDAAVKFEKGQKEHGGKLQDIDLEAAIKEEIIDQFWYTAAKTWPKEHDGRYNKINTSCDAI